MVSGVALVIVVDEGVEGVVVGEVGVEVIVGEVVIGGVVVGEVGVRVVVGEVIIVVFVVVDGVEGVCACCCKVSGGGCAAGCG